MPWEPGILQPTASRHTRSTRVKAYQKKIKGVGGGKEERGREEEERRGREVGEGGEGGREKIIPA